MFNFKTHQVQAVMFVSSESTFRNAKVLGHFLAHRSDLFDGEPITLETPTNLVINGLFMPRVILNNQDRTLSLQASRDRVQLVCSVPIERNIDIEQHFAQSVDVFSEYLKVMSARVVRLAAVVQRATWDENPSKSIAQHFCQSRLVEGPMNRPSGLEIHSLKQYQFSPLKQKINSWFRCRSATVALPGPINGEVPIIDVEQDWNTQDEGFDFWADRPNQIRDFYHLAPAELAAIMNLYFPEDKGFTHEYVR